MRFKLRFPPSFPTLLMAGFVLADPLLKPRLVRAHEGFLNTLAQLRGMPWEPVQASLVEVWRVRD